LEEKRMDWISIALEEYKTLRNESLNSMQTQQSTLRTGSAAIAVIMAAGFSLWTINELLPGIIFLGAVPILSYLILTIWMGEVYRMMRAGKHLCGVENRINEKLDEEPKPLTWENWLREKQADKKPPQMLFNYLCIIILFFFLAVGSVVVGDLKVWAKLGSCEKWLINIFESGFFMFFFVKTLIQGREFQTKY
jgi:hypothetical protein